MLGKGLQLKTTVLLVIILWSVVSKVFDKLINNRLVDDLEKCGLFSDFQYVFRSSHRLLWVSINQPYGFARNTVIMSGLVLSVATWKC